MRYWLLFPESMIKLVPTICSPYNFSIIYYSPYYLEILPFTHFLVQPYKMLFVSVYIKYERSFLYYLINMMVFTFDRFKILGIFESAPFDRRRFKRLGVRYNFRQKVKVAGERRINMSEKFSDLVMSLVMVLIVILLIIEEFWFPLLVIIGVYCIIRYVNYKTR
jgi:hypothetical protein